jgi:hypothetical protein
MRVFIGKKGIVGLVLAGLLYFSVVPTRVFADDKENGARPPKRETAPASQSGVVAQVTATAGVALSTGSSAGTNAEPFAFADFPTWLNDILATDQSRMDSKTSALDGEAAEAPSSILGNRDPQNSADPATKQGEGTRSNNVLTGNFFHRLVQFYKQDWAGTNPVRTSPAKRGLPAPPDSPPFPFSDWGYGGSPNIGAPDGNTYPLMSALNLENSRTKIYEWVATSINFSTSAKNNFPVSYDIFPNKIELNQAVIYVERLPDTVQNTHFDWATMSQPSTVPTIGSPQPKITSASNS